MLPPFVERYLRSRSFSGPWRLEGDPRRDFDGAVVIPALAEEADLFNALQSLLLCAPQIHRFLVVIVVNHRADASPCQKADNLRTLQRLSQSMHAAPLAWVDAASPGKELPRAEGVGAARKIGCDLALERLNWSSGTPLLAFLDADTLVDSRYLAALLHHFARATRGAAVVPFAHREGETALQHKAIVRYELFLRSYVLGLRLAASPYAFHTVGSTIACRAEAYVRAGGMNRRLAGEDFYFLQQLAKTCGVAPLRGTVVRPSARPSTRTPFGTGQSVSRQVAGEEKISFYHPQCFTLLGRWLSAANGADPARSAYEVCVEIDAFLRRERFPEIWRKLQHNHRSETLQSAFHHWFDALKTLRLIHHLSAVSLPRCDWSTALGPLVQKMGRSLPEREEEALELLRHFQGIPDAGFASGDYLV